MEMDSLTLTLIFIFVSALFGAFLRRRSRDKCLLDFDGDMAVLQHVDGREVARGLLDVESTGLEFRFPEPVKDDKGLFTSSYMFYKYEFEQILTIIRFHDLLDEEAKARRDKELAATYRPKFWRRMKRRLGNFFKTIRDSLEEVLQVIVSQVQKVGKTGEVLASQNKYVSKMQGQLLQSVGTAYEPLLEQYIGRRVVFELIKGGVITKYDGVLKDYTQDYVEIMDVHYAIDDKGPWRVADMIFPQRFCIVRHFGERLPEHELKDKKSGKA